VRNEQPVDGDPERADDAIENIEAGIGSSALDLRDRLSANARDIRESGLRKSGPGAFEYEIPAQDIPRGWPGVWRDLGHERRLRRVGGYS
jgi:hypothetical protein